MTVTLSEDARTLRLVGTVGNADLFGDGFTAGEIARVLAAVADDLDLTVRLNSSGGFADEGVAIHSMLRARAGTTTVIVESIAASAGSVIAMAGDKIVMTPGAVAMLHEPMVSFINANGADLAQAAAGQAAFTTAYANVYARRTGRSVADVRALMASTAWFDAEAAVAAGFADEVGEGTATDPAPFDFTTYANAPDRLVAMAVRNDWSLAAATLTRPTANAKPADGEVEAMRAELEELRADAAARRATDADNYERERIEAMRDTPVASSLAQPVPPRRTTRTSPPDWGSFTRNNGAA